MNKRKLITWILLIASGYSALAVQDTSRYFVYFKDKADSPYSVNAPQEFLTQRAIDRRSRQGIAITEQDLPPNPAYVQALREAEIDVFFTSRWLNGALIQTDETNEESIRSLDFVDSLRLIAKGKRLTDQPQEINDPITFTDPIANYATTDIQLAMIGGLEMHQDEIKGQGMLIAVLDNGYTGVNQFTPFQHLWENNQIVATRDFVENTGNVFQFGSHGTSVFSIMAAQFITDTTDFYGVAYESDFILCITEDDQAENTIEEYNWLLGAEFADSLGADVINGSLGYNTFDITEHNYTKEDLDGTTAIVSNAATIAAQKGMIIVTSAGNSGRSAAPRNLISHPSDAFGGITVGSVNVDFTRSNFSSVGPTADGRIKPDLAAFGEATAIIRGNGEIIRGSGTSFASPIIAGLAACVWQMNPERTVAEVIWSMQKSGHQADRPDNLLGYGVPNYLYAKDVKALNVQDILEEKVLFYPNPFSGDTLYLLTDGAFSKGMHIRIMDARGTTIFDQAYKARDILPKMELLLDSPQQGVYYLILQTGNDRKVVKLINF